MDCLGLDLGSECDEFFALLPWKVGASETKPKGFEATGFGPGVCGVFAGWGGCGLELECFEEGWPIPDFW